MLQKYGGGDHGYGCSGPSCSRAGGGGGCGDDRVSFVKHSSGRGRRGPRGGHPEWSQ